jgi:hypothetical protein
MLKHREEEFWQTLSSFSKKFSKVKKSYSAYDRELTALFSGVKFFRAMIE